MIWLGVALLSIFTVSALVALAAFIYLLDADFTGPRVIRAAKIAVVTAIIAAVSMCVLVGLDEAGILA